MNHWEFSYKRKNVLGSEDAVQLMGSLPCIHQALVPFPALYRWGMVANHCNLSTRKEVKTQKFKVIFIYNLGQPRLHGIISQI